MKTGTETQGFTGDIAPEYTPTKVEQKNVLKRKSCNLVKSHSCLIYLSRQQGKGPLCFQQIYFHFMLLTSLCSNEVMTLLLSRMKNFPKCSFKTPYLII